MLAIKACPCGATTFKILVDIKIYVACTKCGGFFTNPKELPELPETPVQFQLSPA